MLSKETATQHSIDTALTFIFSDFTAYCVMSKERTTSLVWLGQMMALY